MIEMGNLLNTVLHNRVEGGHEKGSAVVVCFPGDDLALAIGLYDTGVLRYSGVYAVGVPAGVAGTQPFVDRMALVGLGYGRIVRVFYPPVIIDRAVLPLCIEPVGGAVACHENLSALFQEVVNEAFALPNRRLIGLKGHGDGFEVLQGGFREVVNVQQSVQVLVFPRFRESVLRPDAVEE